jgi:hypothetical protein
MVLAKYRGHARGKDVLMLLQHFVHAVAVYSLD